MGFKSILLNILISQDIHCPVNNSENIYLIRFDMVDNSAGAFNYFSNGVNFIPRHNAAGQRVATDLLRAPCQAIHHAFDIFRGILGNVRIEGVNR